MKPWKTFSHGKLYHGNCIKVMKQLPEKSVHLCVTSPPYFGLRSYEGTAVWVGGDSLLCDHIEAVARTRQDLAEWSAANAAGGGHAVPTPMQYKDVCGKCGAKRQDEQIGLEPEPDCGRWQIPVDLRDKHPELQPCRRCFVCAMVLVGRRVRRVLRDDGVFVLNLGDSYATNPKKGKSGEGKNSRYLGGVEHTKQTRGVDTGLREKNLWGVPWRVAFALQADGWILRSDIPWVKRSAMPESATDRPAKALEYLFVFSKEPKYYWDVAAVRRSSAGIVSYATPEKLKTYRDEHNNNGLSGSSLGNACDTRNFRNADLWFESVDEPHGLVGVDDELVGLDVTMEPLAIKHFAAFPSGIPEPFIKAGTSAHGCCSACGANWRRRVAKRAEKRERPNQFTKREGKQGTGNVCANDVAGVSIQTLGWEPSCSCKADVVPCTVLDPFNGTGTTAVVAQRLGRHFVGIDLSEDYLGMAAKRIESRGSYGKTKEKTLKRKGFLK